MNFKEWLDETKPADLSVKKYILALTEKSGVSYTTFYTVLKGMKLSNYKKASAIAALTNGRVEVMSLLG
jgi:hypothetical protein